MGSRLIAAHQGSKGRKRQSPARACCCVGRKSQKLAIAVPANSLVCGTIEQNRCPTAQRIFVGLEAGLDTIWPPRFNGQDVNHRPFLAATFHLLEVPVDRGDQAASPVGSLRSKFLKRESRMEPSDRRRHPLFNQAGDLCSDRYLLSPFNEVTGSQGLATRWRQVCYMSRYNSGRTDTGCCSRLHSRDGSPGESSL
jgi:hypothetical protein